MNASSDVEGGDAEFRRRGMQPAQRGSSREGTREGSPADAAESRSKKGKREIEMTARQRRMEQENAELHL